MKKIILASSSPRRKELLTTAGIKFEIHVKEVDETVPEGTPPEEAAKMTAARKAAAVSEDFSDCVVIGADTIVVADGKILGKPKDEDNAKSMLRMLSGVEHKVITGVCIIRNGNSETFAKISKVKFYDLTDEEILAYVATGEPMDKAGAYGIQGLGCRLVESIEGDYFNIVGLPVAEVCRKLNK